MQSTKSPSPSRQTIAVIGLSLLILGIGTLTYTCCLHDATAGTYKEIIIPSFGVFSAIIGGSFGLYIYYRNSQLRRAEWLYSLFDKFFYQDRYADIRQMLDNYDPALLSKFEGALATGANKNLEEKLVDYLNFFEFVATLWRLKQLSIEEIQMMFEYYVRQLFEYPFIMTYLENEGFEGLVMLVAEIRGGPQHTAKDDFLFVYGTLRRDANSEMYHLLAQHAEFTDKGQLQGRLYTVENYPGAIPSTDPQDVVHGEVYRLRKSAPILSRLDQYEGCGPGFTEPTEFVRSKKLITLRSGNSLDAWVYIYNRPITGLAIIESGDFLRAEDTAGDAAEA